MSIHTVAKSDEKEKVDSCLTRQEREAIYYTGESNLISTLATVLISVAGFVFLALWAGLHHGESYFVFAFPPVLILFAVLVWSIRKIHIRARISDQMPLSPSQTKALAQLSARHPLVRGFLRVYAPDAGRALNQNALTTAKAIALRAHEN